MNLEERKKRREGEKKIWKGIKKKGRRKGNMNKGRKEEGTRGKEVWRGKEERNEGWRG